MSCRRPYWVSFSWNFHRFVSWNVRFQRHICNFCVTENLLNSVLKINWFFIRYRHYNSQHFKRSYLSAVTVKNWMAPNSRVFSYFFRIWIYYFESNCMEQLCWMWLFKHNSFIYLKNNNKCFSCRNLFGLYYYFNSIRCIFYMNIYFMGCLSYPWYNFSRG